MASFKRISTDEAWRLIKQGGISVADIRKPEDFAAGHIQGAQNINDKNISDFVQRTDKLKPLICCCYHGISSQNAASYFVEQEFKDVYSIDGGWEDWRTKYGTV